MEFMDQMMILSQLGRLVYFVYLASTSASDLQSTLQNNDSKKLPSVCVCVH
uniref:Uncharacterized protein n=1 Tax=Anguilla anguilla TaxID=7936 RepID=A0A0E9R1J4_ANGAN